MRFFIIAAALAVSLVSAASAPRAADAPFAARQVTRAQVVRRHANKGMRKRQSLPSGGVYPTCAGSPATGSTSYAVIQGVQVTSANPNRPLVTLESLNTGSALDCTRRCIDNTNCLSTFYDSSVTNGGVNCILYDYYDSALQNADATSTYAFQTCTQWSTTYAAGADVTCCNYNAA